MEYQQNGFSKFTKVLRDYWFLIIFLGGIIFSWAIFTTTTSSNIQRIEKLETVQNGTTKDIGEIKTSIKGIETSVGFLIEDMKQRKK